MYCPTGKDGQTLKVTARHLVRTYIKQGIRLGAYECKKCHLRHVTKQFQRCSFQVADALLFSLLNDVRHRQ